MKFSESFFSLKRAKERGFLENRVNTVKTLFFKLSSPPSALPSSHLHGIIQHVGNFMWSMSIANLYPIFTSLQENHQIKKNRILCF